MSVRFGKRERSRANRRRKRNRKNRVHQERRYEPWNRVNATPEDRADVYGVYKDIEPENCIGHSPYESDTRMTVKQTSYARRHREYMNQKYVRSTAPKAADVDGHEASSMSEMNEKRWTMYVMTFHPLV